MTFKKARPLSVTLLTFLVLFQALSALFGGGALLLDPSGHLLGVPLSVLGGSPFSDFLLPALVLFVVLGVFPAFIGVALWTAPKWRGMTWLERSFHEHWAWTGAGVVAVALLIFLAVELWMVGFSGLLLFYGVIGVSILGLTLLPSTRRYYRA